MPDRRSPVKVLGVPQRCRSVLVPGSQMRLQSPFRTCRKKPAMVYCGFRMLHRTVVLVSLMTPLLGPNPFLHSFGKGLLS